MSDNYNNHFLVNTETFQGPLDLLLSLIEKRKLLINEISLAKITDDYLEYLKAAENISLKNNAHFILIASTLLLIKSKSLLPTLELTIEEKDDIKDLETRLKVYKRIKDTEQHLINLFDKNPNFYKQSNSRDDVVFTMSPNISLQSIQNSILDILKNLPKKEKLPKTIVRKVVSLEETIINLTNRVKQNISMSFREFSGLGKAEKVNVVINFLAMLELVKQGIIEVNQDNNYADIEMQTKVFDTPNYS